MFFKNSTVSAIYNVLITAFFLLFITACSKTEIVIPANMVLIPESDFIIGSNAIDTVKIKDKGEYKMLKPLYEDEYPEHKINLKAFLIDKYEVTNIQFWNFQKSYNYAPGKDNHPATNMPWHKAKQYCQLIKKRLPTAEEWEKAARGPNGNIYPWGNEFDSKFANTGKSNIKDTTPVGLYEKGKSYFGVHDMVGNASEWTSSWYKAYIGSKNKNPDFGEKKKEIKGSSWGGVGHYKLAAFNRASQRRSAIPSRSIPDVGFRCASDIF